MDDTTLPSDNPLRFRKNPLKMTVIDSKIEQYKTQYNLYREKAKISALSSGNVGKYQVLIGEDILLGRELLEKAAAMKRFGHRPLG